MLRCLTIEVGESLIGLLDAVACAHRSQSFRAEDESDVDNII